MMVEEDPNDVPPTARLFWMAHYFRIVATFLDRYELECIDGYELFRALPKDKVEYLRQSGDLVIEPRYFDIDGRPAKSGSQIHLLAGRPPSVVRRTLIAYTKASMFNRAYKAGKTVLYETRPASKSQRRRRKSKAVTADVWLKENEAAIHAACRPFYVLDPNASAGHEKPRLGQFPPPSLGSVSTLKKDRAKIARKGFRITDLCPKIEDMRRGGRRLADDMASFAIQEIKSVLLRPERMNLSAFRKHLSAQLRSDPKMALRRAPSLAALRGLIGTLQDASVVAARFGEKEAIECRKIYTEGPVYTYPGEMALMDCWKMDVVARLSEQGGWIFVSDPELKEWGLRRRLWICWVLDACSRAILGIALGLSESTDLTRRAFRMAITDSTLQSRSAGCTGEPLPVIGLNGMLTDISTSFDSPYFQVPARTLVQDVDIGPGDSPELRGALERFNRTAKEGLLAYFTGTTFGSVTAKGNYDSMERASADAKTLGQAVWLWARDVYNRSAHRGLDNQTPYDRFLDTYNNYGAPDRNSEEEVRIGFGVEVLLPLTGQGCCFASNRYRSGRLQVFFSDNGCAPNGDPIKLRAKIDPADLGRVSVYFEGEWHTLAGPARMRGVGLTDWLETRRALAKLYGEQRAVHADIVAKALLRLEQLGTDARMRSNVRDQSYGSHDVVRAVKKIVLRIKEQEVAMQKGALLALDSTTNYASYPATGDDFEDQIEAVEDPYADGEKVRAETDPGLDDVDIDQDGELLKQPDNIDETPEQERPDSKPGADFKQEPPMTQTSNAASQTRRLEPLPQPAPRRK